MVSSRVSVSGQCRAAFPLFFRSSTSLEEEKRSSIGIFSIRGGSGIRVRSALSKERVYSFWKMLRRLELERAWREFEEDGSIDTYLRYEQLRQELEVLEEQGAASERAQSK